MPEVPDVLGLGAIAIGLLTAWTRMRAAIKKIEVDGDASLRTDLLQRIVKLEADNKNERERCDTIVEAVRKQYTVLIERMQKEHDAKMKTLQEKVDDLIKLVLKKEIKE